MLSLESTTSGIRLPFWRSVFDQGAVTPSVIDHAYPGSGTEDDPYVITWIPNDPRNPQLSPEPRKWFITALVSLAALAVSLISSAYSGSLNEILEYFDISREVSYLGISLYVLGFALGPVFWAPLSELYGRRRIYIISMSSLTIFTAGVAGAKNTETLLILRFLAGSLGSAPMAIPGGVIADLFDPVVRGLAAMLYAASPFLGPVLGPVIGGFIGESGGWRWVHGALALFAATLTVAVVFLFPETYAPVLLRRRAERLQKLTGNIYRSALDGKSNLPLRKTLTVALSRPWLLLFREPIVSLLCTYVAVIYGILYMLFAAYPIVFQEARGWSEGTGGLAFLGILLGILCAIAYAFPAYFRYRRKAALARAKAQQTRLRLQPEDRLPDAFPAAILLPVSLFWFAWTAAPTTIHYLIPIASGIPFGFGMVMVFLPVFNYLIDTYTVYAASALAANTMLRSLFGAAFPLFTGNMYDSLGVHWASCVPAFLSVACAPLPFAFYFWGERIRRRSRFAREAERVMRGLLGSN
ncbi:major facilitator superfamily domain-containing protein [Aspergillus carlsbadensis]|nr:major facilitator superfamily domain-containing protein [Aspergillus carlsbadensis]